MPLTRPQINRLAQAYDDAADDIETYPRRYSFIIFARCNCGILAQYLLDIDGVQLIDRLNNVQVGWSRGWQCAVLEPVCPQTGLPLNTLLRELAQAGCTPQELADLENVGSDRPTVIAYMRRRAAELRAEVGARRIVEHKPERSQACAVEV